MLDRWPILEGRRFPKEIEQPDRLAAVPEENYLQLLLGAVLRDLETEEVA